MAQSWNVVIDSSIGSLTFGFDSREQAESFWRILSQQWQEGKVQMEIDTETGSKAVRSSDFKGVWLTSWADDDIAVSVTPRR